MSFGDKTKKTESELDVKAHISFILEGEGVDKIDWLKVFTDQNDNISPFRIVHGDVKMYFTEKKDNGN